MGVIGFILILNCYLVGYLIMNKIGVGKDKVFFLHTASFLIGVLFCGSAFYLLDLLAVGLFKSYLYTAHIYTLCLTVFNIYRLKKSCLYIVIWEDYKKITQNKKKCFILLLFLIFAVFFYFKSFYFKDGKIITDGAWNDITYHHAYVSTIANGSNVPVTYPYFANHDIAYHFMFNYYAGKVAQAGMNSLYALNIMSALTLFALLVLMIEFCEIVFKSMWTGVLSCIFMLFHGSLAFFRWISETGMASLLPSVLSRSNWLAYEKYESWALFNIYVLRVQRHFAMALALILLFVIFIFLLYKPHIRTEKIKSNKHHETKPICKSGIRDIIKMLKSDWRQIIFLVVFLGCLPYWNMISVICCGMFLGLFAIVTFVRNNKQASIQMLLIGILSLVFILPQLYMFKTSGDSLKGYPKIFLGYFLGKLDLTVLGRYYINVIGIKLLIIFLIFIRRFKGYRLTAAIFITPFLFANIIQMGVVQYDNNKLMWVTLMFINLYCAWFVTGIWNEKLSDNNMRYSVSKIPTDTNLFKRRIESSYQKITNRRRLGKFFTCILIAGLIFSMTASGIVDFISLSNMKTVEIEYRDSHIKHWIEENTPRNAIFLTYNRVSFDDTVVTQVNLAGRLLYGVRSNVDPSCDVIPREKLIERFYQDSDMSLVETVELLNKEKINYIVIDDKVRANYSNLRLSFFIDNFNLVYDNNNIMIFEVPVILQ